MKSELMGLQARDRVTGFTGTVTGHCCFLTDEETVRVAPQVIAGQASDEPRWINIGCLDVRPGEPIDLKA